MATSINLSRCFFFSSLIIAILKWTCEFISASFRYCFQAFVAHSSNFYGATSLMVYISVLYGSVLCNTIRNQSLPVILITTSSGLIAMPLKTIPHQTTLYPLHNTHSCESSPWDTDTMLAVARLCCFALVRFHWVVSVWRLLCALRDTLSHRLPKVVLLCDYKSQKEVRIKVVWFSCPKK